MAKVKPDFGTAAWTMAEDIAKASALLGEYLSEFPEHDQGDFRIWEAKQILDRSH